MEPLHGCSGSIMCLVLLSVPMFLHEYSCRKEHINYGTFMFGMPFGFYTDINECEGVNECEQICINTDGSHECSCRQGFELAADARSCNGKHLISIFSHTV